MEHSKNFAKVKRFYDMKLWSESRVRNAVTANPAWITEAEYREIVGRKYEEVPEADGSQA